MGRIKGWTKMQSYLDSSKEEYRYDRWVRKNTMITVEKIGSYFKVYISKWIPHKNSIGQWKSESIYVDGTLYFRTKQKPLTYAIKYMRSHPNG